jgi:subtilisin-like proprotein convertase family protein
LCNYINRKLLKMKKLLLFSWIITFPIYSVNAQNKTVWKINHTSSISIIKDKAIARENFPKEFKLFNLDIVAMRQLLFSTTVNRLSNKTTIITLPNVDGNLEEFQIYEASNFEPDLQAKFPEIRAYSGKGITDKYATLKLSISPQGIQTMVFRANKENEFIEAYSEDHSVYAVFKSQREKGKLAWSCTIDEQNSNRNVAIQTNNLANRSSSGEVKTMRLAQSCNGEYANYFGANAGNQATTGPGLVMAAFNATLTRGNGVYEKDLGLHLNLIANTVNLIFYTPTTDPYTTMANWNTQLQNTISTSLTGPATSLAANNAAYDIGHMFGATGGGGNAGCIGCVCVDDTASTTDKNKGAGITSPNNGIPQGDSFDIDYVVHEIGHQLGGTHTFSHNNEGSGTNKEVGSGITIMGYAGITSYDIAAHSIDAYHESSISQIQANLATKTCPVTTSLAGINATPVVNSVQNYTIPKSTPFILTGSATDANTGDALTYSWEQDDDGIGQTGANSPARINKPTGPNFISWSPTASPSRYFPKLASILSNSATTLQVGGDTGLFSEALSSVARTLKFRLTVRDNAPYSSVAPISIGQTAFTDMSVTVNATAGPFTIISPNTNVSWTPASNEIVTWNVAGTTANGVNCPYVDIFSSSNSGNDFPVLLASKVPNDGSETILVPNTLGTTNRLMVRGNNHIFLDVTNTNFTIANPTATFGIDFSGIAGGQNKTICQSANTSFDINYTTLLGFSDVTNFTVTGNPAGSTVTFSQNSISNDGIVILNITNTQFCTPGLYTLLVTGTSGAVTKTVNLYLEVLNSTFATMQLSTPNNNAFGISASTTLSWIADPVATNYDVQVATDDEFTTIIRNANVTTNSYAVAGLADITNYFWRVLPKNAACFGVFSETYRFTTEQTFCSTPIATDTPIAITSVGTTTINSVINIPVGSGINISKIKVTANLTHTYSGDLSLVLTSPANNIIRLVTNQCGASQNINATFDDTGAVLVCGSNPAISGSIKPVDPLSVLNGQNSSGIWTLTVTDNANGDGGFLNNWSMNICDAPDQTSTCGQITTTWNGTSWSNGKPVDNVFTTISGNYNSISDLKACALNITGNAQVTINSGNNLIVKGAINVAPTANFVIENNANLIQIDDVVNNGFLTAKRNTSALMRLDYVNWSSPVLGSQTLKQFSPLTLNNRFYDFDTPTNLYSVVTNPLTTTFAIGKGYLIRMPDNHPTTPTIFSGLFTGTPNNGTIDVNLTYSGVNNSFNLIGNPYPSTINAFDFLSANATTINGALYFWRKTNAAAGTAYATYTIGGATTTSPTSPTPNGVIQVGQGFLVEAKNVATPKVTFSNLMRIGNNANQFFRLDNTIPSDRIWLNLSNTTDAFSQMLLSYMPNATNMVDEYDAKGIDDSPLRLSSGINNEAYTIQSRAPFINSDIVPLYFKTDIAGDYTIAIDHFDGLFEGSQKIFLKDTANQSVTDLKNVSYTFSTNAGIFNSRFELVFQNPTLATSNFENSSKVIVFSSNNKISINSSNEFIEKVVVYDMLGRQLYDSKNIKINQLTIDNLKVTNQALFVKITLANGKIETRKIIF